MNKTFFLLFAIIINTLSALADQSGGITEKTRSMFLDACRKKNTSLMETIINQCKNAHEKDSLINYTYFLESDLTPLHIAVKHDSIAMTLLLLQSGADINKKFGFFQETALFYAKSKKIIEILLDHHANPSIKNICGNTAAKKNVIVKNTLLSRIASRVVNEVIEEVLAHQRNHVSQQNAPAQSSGYVGCIIS